MLQDTRALAHPPAPDTGGRAGRQPTGRCSWPGSPGCFLPADPAPPGPARPHLLPAPPLPGPGAAARAPQGNWGRGDAHPPRQERAERRREARRRGCARRRGVCAGPALQPLPEEGLERALVLVEGAAERALAQLAELLGGAAVVGLRVAARVALLNELAERLGQVHLRGLFQLHRDEVRHGCHRRRAGDGDEAGKAAAAVTAAPRSSSPARAARPAALPAACPDRGRSPARFRDRRAASRRSAVTRAAPRCPPSHAPLPARRRSRLREVAGHGGGAALLQNCSPGPGPQGRHSRWEPRVCTEGSKTSGGAGWGVGGGRCGEAGSSSAASGKAPLRAGCDRGAQLW